LWGGTDGKRGVRLRKLDVHKGKKTAKAKNKDLTPFLKKKRGRERGRVPVGGSGERRGT